MILPALVVKELQTWLHGRLTFAAFTALVLATSVLVFLLGLLVLAPDANAAPTLFSTASTTSTTNLLVTNRALFLFGAVGICVVLAAAVVAPAVAASAFAGERERGTLDLLLLNGQGAGRVVLGKLLAALIFSLLLLVVAAPLFAPSWSFGGVQLEQLAAFAAVLVAATALFVAIGILFAAIFERPLTASLFAQAASLFLLFGTLGVHFGVNGLGGADAARSVLWLNPFLALLSIGGSVTESFARQAPIAVRSAMALPPVALPGMVLPAWALASMLWLALTALFTFVASVVIDPYHPLKVRGVR